MAHPQPSPPGGVPPHHGPLAAHPQLNGHIPVQSAGQKGPPLTTAQKIAALNEQVWLQIGIPAMTAISQIMRTREQFPKAIEYLQQVLKLDPQSGETWGSLGTFSRYINQIILV